MNIIIAMMALLVITFTPAKAESDDNRWVRRSVWSSCDWWGNCTRHRYRKWEHTRRYVRERYRPAVRYYAPPRDEHADYRNRCIGRSLSRVGEERYGRDRAKEAAEQALMEEIRSRYGVRYMDLRNARRLTYECGRSSTGNRSSEKSADVVGRFLEQCIVEAEPCRAGAERDDK